MYASSILILHYISNRKLEDRFRQLIKFIYLKGTENLFNSRNTFGFTSTLYENNCKIIRDMNTNVTSHLGNPTSLG